MNNANKQVWGNLEKGIGRCILVKDSAIREVKRYSAHILCLATLSPKERVEDFLKDKKIISRSDGIYVFMYEGLKIELYCYKPEENIEKSFNNIFSHILRCDNLGMTIDGRFNKNSNAYKDITDEVVHFEKLPKTMPQNIISRILKYVFYFGYRVGDDIISFVNEKNTFTDKTNLIKFCQCLCEYVKKEKWEWQRVANGLELLRSVLPEGSSIIENTKNFNIQTSDNKFILSYLYHLFIILGLSSIDLQAFMKEEKSLQYFDSLGTKIYAKLHDYKEYSEIKANYGDDFLELLMDVQECSSRVEGYSYERVSDAYFDVGEMLLSDKMLWCSRDDLIALAEESLSNEADSNTETDVDLSNADAQNWLKDEYKQEDYKEDEERPKDKKYIDDIDEDSQKNGLDLTAIEELEQESINSNNPDTAPNKETVNTTEVAEKSEEKTDDSDIMNPIRGHESTVLNTGGK